jgi:putative endonuclease
VPQNVSLLAARPPHGVDQDRLIERRKGCRRRFVTANPVRGTRPRLYICGTGSFLSRTGVAEWCGREYYVGLTSNPKSRLEAHNAGLSSHASAHRPWKPLVVIEFHEEEPAMNFERYLKTGSGREFARRHFRQAVAPSTVGPRPQNDR